MTSQSPLSEEELERYSRHLVIPEVGIEGQQKLKAASVLVVGAGGLGSPVIQYLAAAGVGTLGVVDFDEIDKSNLQRQVLYSTENIGQYKADVACERAFKQNPDIVHRKHRTRLNATNVVELFEDYSVIVDGSDNFETRYLINDACVVLGKPNVHGAVHRFDGQVSIFSVKEGPCYRCVFSQPPQPGAVMNCAEAGVLGVLPGIVGTIQATECIKLILSIGTPLIGKLMLIDALDMTFQTIKISRDPKCIACGDAAEIRSVNDLLAKHGTVDSSVHSQCSSNNVQLTPQQLSSELADSDSLLVIDVREVDEYNHSHLKSAIHIPLSTLSQRLQEIPKGAEVIVYCKSGVRSQKAVAMLQQAGIQNVRHLKGGLSAWSKQVDTSMSIL